MDTCQWATDYYTALPEKPFYSADKRQHGKFDTRENVINAPYLGHNFPLVNFIHVDCDYPNPMLHVYESDLPKPTFAIYSKNKKGAPNRAGAHLVYQLASPCHHRKSSRKTIEIFQHVTWGLRDTLCADKIIYKEKQLAKNALATDFWETDVIGGQWFLQDLIAELRRVGWRPTPKKELHDKNRIEDLFDKQCLNFAEYVGIGRNQTLFDYIRHFAYRQAAEGRCVTYQVAYDILIAEAKAVNERLIPQFFPRPLPHIELYSTCRSIAKYVTAYSAYWVAKRKRQILGRPTVAKEIVSENGGKYVQPGIFEQTLKNKIRERQSEGGKVGIGITNRLRTERVDAILAPFIYSDMSNKAIARLTELHPTTVSKYRKKVGSTTTP